jgi:cardiolipin synthase A/B
MAINDLLRLRRRAHIAREQWLEGNHVQLLESGRDYFPALIAAIGEAREEIHMETYIFADDATGQAVIEALCRAVQRGVAVRLLVDGFGARDFHDTPTLGARLKRTGGEVLVYRPDIARYKLSRQRLRRLHRKLTVIDGRIGFIGGINILDDYDTPPDDRPNDVPPPPAAPRFDFALRVTGPVVERMHRSLRHVWRLVRWVTFGARPAPPAPLKHWSNSAQIAAQNPAQNPAQNSAQNPASARGVSARFVERDSLRHRYAIERAYLDAITAAQHEIILANAYFLPGKRFRRALNAAAKRGVHVTLLLQGRIEYALLHYATLGLYRLLTQSSIRIVEYRASFLHAKVAVIDGEWATVGSSNIDPFSLLLAREANLVIRDAGFATELRSRLLAAMDRGGIEITRHDIIGWSWWQQTLTRLAYRAMRLLVRLGGRDPDSGAGK